MTQIFVPRKYDVLEKRSFEAGAALKMGKMVELNSDKEVILATSAEKAIGIVDDMPEYRAENSTATVAEGDMAQIALFGVTFIDISGGTFSIGAYVKPSSGAIITSGATASRMIAVTASTAAGQSIEYIKI